MRRPRRREMGTVLSCPTIRSLPGMPEPVRLTAAAVGLVGIRNVSIFPIEIPIPRAAFEAGTYMGLTFFEMELDVWRSRILV